MLEGSLMASREFCWLCKSFVGAVSEGRGYERESDDPLFMRGSGCKYSFSSGRVRRCKMD